MLKLPSIEDDKDGFVTYKFDCGLRVRLDARLVKQFGTATMLREMGYGHLIPTEPRKVYSKHGRLIGTLPGDFDPDNIKSMSFWYDPRPGDFMLDGEIWRASRTLGPGDFEAIPGFVRHRYA